MANENKIAVTVTDLVGGVFEPHTGLTITNFSFVLADSLSTVISFTGFADNGNGSYEFWGFDVPDFDLYDANHVNAGNARVMMKINGTLQPAYGIFVVYSDVNPFVSGVNDSPVSRSFVDGRVDRLGDTMKGFITYDNADWHGVNALTAPTDYQLVHKKWVSDHFVDSTTGGGYVTISGTQTITGNKTFSGTSTFTGNTSVDVGTKTSGGFVVYTYEGALGQDDVKALEVKYNGSSNETIPITTMLNPQVDSAGSLYTGVKPIANNGLVWKKWVTDNFQPISSGTGYYPQIIWVDSKVDPSGEAYPYFHSVTTALVYIAGLASPSSSNRWEIRIREHIDVLGYVENVNLPDWISLVGEGIVHISGTFSRTTSGSVTTSKVENVNFIPDSLIPTTSHSVENCEVFNCVFSAGGSGNIALAGSKLKNSGFYILGGSVVSTDKNKIIDCFGNKSVTWQSNDKVYSYNYIAGDTFALIGS